MTSKTIKIFVAVNQEGEFFVAEDASEAVSVLQNRHVCDAIRTIALNVTLDLPAIETVPVMVPAQEQAPSQVQVS